ncbi:hypothetical protein OG394_05390 [Kribbella sp. NBC_01245]|nr:hypothetical protein [Kribbella sp. NBC_01245]
MTAETARRLVLLLGLLECPSGGEQEDDALLESWFGPTSPFCQDG